MGVVVAAQVGVCDGEVAVRAGLGGPVVQPSRGVQGGVLGGGPVVPVAPPVEEDEQCQGQLAGVAVEPGAGGLVDGCEQHGCSAVNHAIAWSGPVGSWGETPGWGGVRVIVSPCRFSSRAAVWAVWR